jgi:hypothetical protein
MRFYLLTFLSLMFFCEPIVVLTVGYHAVQWEAPGRVIRVSLLQPTKIASIITKSTTVRKYFSSASKCCHRTGTGTVCSYLARFTDQRGRRPCCIPSSSRIEYWPMVLPAWVLLRVSWYIRRGTARNRLMRFSPNIYLAPQLDNCKIDPSLPLSVVGYSITNCRVYSIARWSADQCVRPRYLEPNPLCTMGSNSNNRERRHDNMGRQYYIWSHAVS